MSQEPCERSWEVEAALDGRLDPASRAAFEQHLARCRACQVEHEALRKLVHELRKIASDVDEVALRRLRQQTMDRAHRALTVQTWRPRRALAAGVAALVVALGLIAFLRRDHVPTRQAVVSVVPQGAASWQRTVERDVERVELTSGVLQFRVARALHAPRLVVVVPEGEIEDIGTTFSVAVRAGKTVEIAVSQGRVLFHRRGLPELQLVAGSAWRPLEDEAKPAVSQPSVDAGAADRAAPLSESRRTLERARARPAVNRPTPQSGEEASARGSREDSAYLRVLDLLRRGRHAEARLAANEYLRAFPGGFRRLEIERVVRSLAVRSDVDAAQR